MSHYKKDGSLDMRYSSSKAAVRSGAGGGSSYSSSSYGGSSGLGSAAYGNSYASPSYSTSAASSGLHHKKDGSLDMRYTSSKEAMATPFSSSAAPQSTPTNLHHKKDGSLDMRYKSSKEVIAQMPLTPPPSSNLHYKKDGTHDMRFKSSKLAIRDLENEIKTVNLSSKRSDAHPKQPGVSNKQSTKHVGKTIANVHSFPAKVPLKKDGTPDMRKNEARKWVLEQTDLYARNNILPCWVPTRKDGTVNASNAIGRMFAHTHPINPSSSSSGQKRKEYWDGRVLDEWFYRLLRIERQKPRSMPPPASLLQASAANLMSGISSLSWKQNSASEAVSVPISVKEIDYSSLKFEDKIIGKGAFGVVQKATWNGIEVAVKILHLSQLTRKEKASFEKEICILAAVGEHENLVYLHGYCINPPCIIMELVERGSLNYLLYYCEEADDEVMMTDGRVKRILMCGVAEGMHQLHTLKIIHGDLKPQNILVTTNYTAKITDFGLSTLRGKTSSSLRSKDIDDDDDDDDYNADVVGGTSGYMAPELLKSTSPPDYSADVYSFAIVLNEVIVEEEPYSDQYGNFAGRGPFGAANYASLGKRPTMNKSTTVPFVEDLIEQCWSPEPKERPTFEKILSAIRDARFHIPDSV